MTFSNAVTTCFRKYVTFSGRATRSEFWFFVLFNVIVSIVVGFLDSNLAGNVGYRSPLESIHALVIFLPALAVQVRRLHDLDKSGFWYLIILVPLIGSIALFVWNITQGTLGDNRFGPSPRNDQPKPPPSSPTSYDPQPEPEPSIRERDTTIPSVKRNNRTVRRR